MKTIVPVTTMVSILFYLIKTCYACKEIMTSQPIICFFQKVGKNKVKNNGGAKMVIVFAIAEIKF